MSKAVTVSKAVTSSTSDRKCVATSVEWTDLCVSLSTKKGTKTILQPATGFVRPGELLAVLGPSGSGKTTLLDALSQRTASSKVSGELTFNGAHISESSRRRLLSYVAQEESLMGVFTVRETLSFAASFHYGRGSTTAVVAAREAMEEVGLGAAADTICGDIFFKGLSGGQRRRLALAVELVKRPSVLVLDEPTSGLDSASAFGIMKRLNALATERDHTIITTIHQPSSQIWAQFDKLTLLAGGSTIYFGAAAGAVSHFARLGYTCPTLSNPADYLLALVNTDFADALDGEAQPEAAMLSAAHSTVPARTEVMKVRDEIGAGGAQGRAAVGGYGRRCKPLSDFLTLTVRNLRNNMRNPGIYWVRMVMYVGLSFMIGLMYKGLGSSLTASSITSRISALFYVAAFLVFMSVAVLPFFIIDRATFVRERGNGSYGVVPYVVSNIVSTVPGLLVIAFASTSCIVPLSGLNGFSTYLAALFASLFTAEAIMCLIASLVPHYIIGIALGAGLFGFFMLCEGFFIVRDDIPAWFIWGHHIAFHTYSFRAFMVNEFEPIAAFDPGAPFASGRDVLRFYGMENRNRPWQDILIIIGFGIFFHLLYACVLQFFHKGKR